MFHICGFFRGERAGLLFCQTTLEVRNFSVMSNSIFVLKSIPTSSLDRIHRQRLVKNSKELCHQQWYRQISRYRHEISSNRNEQMDSAHRTHFRLRTKSFRSHKLSSFYFTIFILSKSANLYSERLDSKEFDSTDSTLRLRRLFASIVRIFHACDAIFGDTTVDMKSSFEFAADH